MTRRLLATAIAIALLPTAAAEAKVLHGTVVHRNAKAKSFTVADRSGRLTAVHARRSPRIGSRVTLRATKLRNGTYKAGRLRAHGRVRRARVRGIVTFVDRSRRQLVLSSRGVSLLVRLARSARARAAEALPAVGSEVTVSATLTDPTGSSVLGDPGSLTSTAAPASDPIDLEGSVLAIDTATRTLTLSADDSEESGATISVTLPDSFDIAAYSVGDEVEVVATLNADGTTYTAVASSGDEGVTEAEDAADDEGVDPEDSSSSSADAPSADGSSSDGSSSDGGRGSSDAGASSDD